MLNTIAVEFPTNAYGVALTAKIPALKVAQGQQVQIQWPIYDSAGNPVDLTPYASAGAVFNLRVAETLGRPRSAINTYPATVITNTPPLLQVTLDTNVTNAAGIYSAQCSIEQPVGKLLGTYDFYIMVERSLFMQTTQLGPPTIADIKLRLRDNSPDDNDLIDKVEFDLTEIIVSLLRPVQFWNEVPPPIGVFDTTNFPEQYHWTNGTVAELLKIAASWYRRNRLPYSAGGTTVDDRNKEAEYTNAANQLWEEYKSYVVQRKVQINVNQFTGSVGSAYSWNSNRFYP